MGQIGLYHYRKRYDLLTLLGDTGGIIETCMLTLGVIFFSISEHSFILTAASKLYMVRTTSEKIFKNVEDFESRIFLKSGILSNTDSTEIKKHKVIKLDLMQSIKLFISRKC